MTPEMQVLISGSPAVWQGDNVTPPPWACVFFHEWEGIQAGDLGAPLRQHCGPRTPDFAATETILATLG